MLHFDVDWLWFQPRPHRRAVGPSVGYGYFFLIPACALSRWSASSEPVVRPRPCGCGTPRHGARALCAGLHGLGRGHGIAVRPGGLLLLYPGHSLGLHLRFQCPLVREAIGFGLVLSVAAPLMWTDPDGRLWSEKVASRWSVFRARPNLGAFAVALALMSVVYIGYGLAFGRSASAAWPRRSRRRGHSREPQRTPPGLLPAVRTAWPVLHRHPGGGAHRQPIDPPRKPPPPPGNEAPTAPRYESPSSSSSTSESCSLPDWSQLRALPSPTQERVSMRKAR